MARKVSFPWKEYAWAPGVGLALMSIWFAFQQWGQGQKWWNELPWLMTIGGIAIFVLGTVHADLWNENSQLRRWWADRQKVFDVTFHAASEVRDGIELQTPYFAVKFLGPVTGYALELMLYEHIQWTNNKSPFLLDRIEAPRFSEGEQVRVPVAVLARNGGAPHFWGSGSAKKSPSRGTGNLIELRAVKNGRVKQRYSVFIAYRESDIETGGLYSYLPEDRHVFRQ